MFLPSWHRDLSSLEVNKCPYTPKSLAPSVAKMCNSNCVINGGPGWMGLFAKDDQWMCLFYIFLISKDILPSRKKTKKNSQASVSCYGLQLHRRLCHLLCYFIMCDRLSKLSSEMSQYCNHLCCWVALGTKKKKNYRWEMLQQDSWGWDSATDNVSALIHNSPLNDQSASYIQTICLKQ